MKNIAIFASGFGSNFENIINKLSNLLNVKVLFSDNPNAYVLKRAKKLGVQTLVINPHNYLSKITYEEAIIKALNNFNLDLVVLAGYMKIIGSALLAKYKNQIINIHPSILPKFKGKNAIERAFKANENCFGVTVHYVNQEIDNGKIIKQQYFYKNEEDNLITITEKVHKLEYSIYPEAIINLIEEN